jgi:hypothetical protein
LALQVLSLLRDRVNVVLEVTPNIRIIDPGRENTNTDYVRITVRNKGKRTVTIQSVGYITKKKKDLNGLFQESLIPRELMDGKSTMYLFRQDDLDLHEIKYFVVRDQAGRDFKGKLA